METSDNVKDDWAWKALRANTFLNRSRELALHVLKLVHQLGDLVLELLLHRHGLLAESLDLILVGPYLPPVLLLELPGGLSDPLVVVLRSQLGLESVELRGRVLQDALNLVCLLFVLSHGVAEDRELLGHI